MSYPGRFAELGVAIEGERNTPASSVDRWMKHVTADILPKAEKVVDDNVRGRLEDAENARVVRQWAEGPVEGVLHVDVAGYFFLNIYGQVETTTVSGAAKLHTFSVLNSAEHPTLTLFRKDAEEASRIYWGGVVKTFELSAATDDYVRFTAEMVCTGQESHTEDAAYATEYDFISKDITVKCASTEGELSGADPVKLKTLAIRYDMGAVSDFVFGSLNPDSNYQNKMAIEIVLTKNHSNDGFSFEEFFLEDAYQYMEVAIEGSVEIIPGHDAAMTFRFNRVKVMEWERSGSADELVEETVTLKAFYNETDEEQSSLAIKNLTAAYVAGS